MWIDCPSGTQSGSETKDPGPSPFTSWVSPLSRRPGPSPPAGWEGTAASLPGSQQGAHLSAAGPAPTPISGEKPSLTDPGGFCCSRKTELVLLAASGRSTASAFPFPGGRRVPSPPRPSRHWRPQ